MVEDENGRLIIRLGDTTDHGGEVITGTDTWTVLGVPVARVGDKVRCPKCDNKIYEIVEGNQKMTLFGRPAAFEYHLTSCGARLISSLRYGARAAQMQTAMQSNLNNSSSVTNGALAANASGSNYRNSLSGTQARPSDLLKLDERAIKMRYYEARDYMIKHNLRFRGYGLAPAIWNNFRAIFGGTYYRCQPQTLFVADWITDLELNYDWSVNVVGGVSENGK